MSHSMLAEQARRAYQVTAIQHDDPLGLVVRLYDGMIGFLRKGAEHLAAGHKGPAGEPIRRAADIVGELQAVLDLRRGGEVAFNLDRIYSYCRRRIMEAHLQADSAGLSEIADLLAPLRDAWVEARLKQQTQPPAETAAAAAGAHP